MISVRCLQCGRYDSEPVALNKGNMCSDFMTFQFRHGSDRMGDNKQITPTNIQESLRKSVNKTEQGQGLGVGMAGRSPSSMFLTDS